MKRIFVTFMAVMSIALCAMAQAEIKFDKTTNNFGTFTDADPIQKCVFKFTNIGNAPLVINQIATSCGCTTPKYTKAPVKPGESGTIEVTYNGKGKVPGYFKKNVTVRSNGNPETVRLYIEGEMKETK